MLEGETEKRKNWEVGGRMVAMTGDPVESLQSRLWEWHGCGSGWSSAFEMAQKAKSVL